jgi:hypothetical protein
MPRPNKQNPTLPEPITVSEWKQAINAVSQHSDDPTARTVTEIAAETGRSTRQTHHWIKKLVEQGRARRCRVTRPDSNGTHRWTSGYILLPESTPPLPPATGGSPNASSTRMIPKKR